MDRFSQIHALPKSLPGIKEESLAAMLAEATANFAIDMLCAVARQKSSRWHTYAV
jgi:hypothetical protein